MTKLLDKDREKIIKTLTEGKDLPTSYQAKLFESDEVDYVEATKDYKLVYKGKTPEARVIAETPAAPLQEMRAFNTDNAFIDKWANMLIFGDNLYALKTIYDDQRKDNKLGTKNKIKLIYIDPPFATKQDFMKDREKAYRDKVIGAEFIEFLRKRLILMREILAADGSIYVHLDGKKGHYIKAIMDEVFLENNFQNEISWCYREAINGKNRWNRKHDMILFYTKSDHWIFNYKDVLQTSNPNSLKKYRYEDEKGFYRLMGRGLANSPISSQRDVNPKWEKTNPELVFRHYWKGGTLAVDYWNIDIVNQAAHERIDYPTQKPERLLERIIKASSNVGDIVLDTFVGSGTAIAVSEKLDRRWIGMDSGKLSIYTAQKRLLNLTEHIGTLQKDDKRDYERVEDFEEHGKTSRALLMIYEKARAGDLVVNDDFLTSLGDFIGTYLSGHDEECFSLICPEEKFQVKKLKVNHNEKKDDDSESAGQKVVKVGRIKFLISFVALKEKAEELKPLKSKYFKLLYAGMYDNEAILKMDWEQYRPFVAQLFDVRLAPHKIKAFEADGYISTHSASIWNYPANKKLEIDEGYVDDLHKVLGGRGGNKFYVVAPIVAMRFMQDEIKRGDTTYVFLKVPLSILIALIQKKQPGALKQPMTKADVNEVIDAVGFDFISQPVARVKYKKTKKEYVIGITEFRSNTLTYDPEEFENFETLSMVMVDVDYNEKTQVFDLDKVYWSDKIVNTKRTKAEIRIPAEEFAGKAMMIIFMDKYGNEYKVIKRKDNFS
ncbi:MAG: site-specific DNA-methyltransferase [bacterium]|nr:site-specific DNA-methyltransferase [bacterium]